MVVIHCKSAIHYPTPTIFGKKSSRKVAKAQRKETNKLKNLAFFAALREKLG
jgi:hypothetical protein